MDHLLGDRKEIELSKKVEVKKRNGRKERGEEMGEERGEEREEESRTRCKSRYYNCASSHEVSLVTSEDVQVTGIVPEH